MTFSEAVSTMRRVMRNCMDDFGGMEANCIRIEVDGDSYSQEIEVYAEFSAMDSSNDSEIKQDVYSTVRSIRCQYSIPYSCNVRVKINHRY